MRRWIIPGVLALVIAGSGALAAQAATDNSATAATAKPTAPSRTPLLSARRVPVALQQTTGRIRLTTALDGAFTDPALGAARDHSCLAVEGAGTLLYARNNATPLIPASNMKLLTAQAALDRLGPDTRFSTDVRADGAPAGGVVNGNLYLVGGGDPLVRTADYNASFQEHALPDDGYTHLEALAQAVVNAGVRHVTGAVVGDEGRYDAQRYVPSWKPQYITDSETGPLSALDVNNGFVTQPPSLPVAAPAPAVLASGSLSALLTKMGVQVDGEPGQGATPSAAVPIASLPSLPVRSIVAEMLRESDNQTAEMLTKELGRRAPAPSAGDAPAPPPTQGTTAAGTAVIHEVAAAKGLPAGDLHGVDGSGLDRTDVATCNLLLGVVEHAGAEGPLAAGLPVAGTTGTLKKRFLGTAAVNRVLAKTGTLDHVAGLTGFVRQPAGPAVTFSLLANDFGPDAVGRALQDRVVAALVAYPDAPSTADLGPVAP